MNTDKNVALITWLIKVAKHPGYVNLISPDEYYDPIMLDQEATKQNTDESQHPVVEDQFGGSAYTFTSSQDPTENNGIYRDKQEFTMAVLNRTSPQLLLHGGKYVNTGRELKLVLYVFSHCNFRLDLADPK